MGTLGISSASYWWSQIAGSIGRLEQHLAGDFCTTWHVLVADDFMLECGAAVQSVTDHILRVVPHPTFGVLLSWVGFEILLLSYSLGVSQRRAEWLVKWTSHVAAAKTKRMASFEEGLGRIMFKV